VCTFRNKNTWLVILPDMVAVTIAANNRSWKEPQMKVLLFAVAALVAYAGIGTGMIPSAYACTDGATAASQQPQYAWQFGYGKGGRSEWHWVRVVK